MVWNVSTGAVIAALEDSWASAMGSAPGAKRPEGGRPPVIGLAWVTASPSVLAVLLAPCILLLWDYRSEWGVSRGAWLPFWQCMVLGACAGDCLHAPQMLE